MPAQYILAFDQGTTSSRAIVFDHDGGIVSTAQKEFAQIFPRPGWVEHDPNEIWSSQISVAAEALSRANVTAAQVAAIGITNQRETTLAWNRRTGEPVYNAIVWQDRRTADTCKALTEAGYTDLVRKRTGLVIDPYFSGTKLKWILDHVEGARELADRGDLLFGTVDSWLVWKLTRGELHMTEISNASRTLLYNIHERKWDPELLEMLGVPASVLPEVRPSSEVYGHTSGDVFSHRIPIAGIAGDQQAALFGQVCTRPGMAKNTYGTGCFMLMQTGEEPIESKNNLVTTIAWEIDGKVEYALEGSVFIAGAVVQWLRDGLNFFPQSSQVEGLAAQVEDTDGVYLVPAFSGLGAPHWDPFARGIIVGITRGTTQAHISRAALDSIAYQSADVLLAMAKDSGISLGELRVDGGASVNDLLMQFQADILGVPVIRPTITETTALGAAYLAGLATGFWDGLGQIADKWQVDREFQPRMGEEERAQRLEGWNRAVERSRGWAS